MFREKGDKTQNQNSHECSSLFLNANSYHIYLRCLGEQAGLSGGLSDRPESRLLWTHSELSETRSADHQRRDQPSGWDKNLQGWVQQSQPHTLFWQSVSSVGVLEEARFFGIEQLAEQLETLIKVFNQCTRSRLYWSGPIMSLLCLSYILSYLFALFSPLSPPMIIPLWLERSLLDFCWPPQPSQSCVVRYGTQTH